MSAHWKKQRWFFSKDQICTYKCFMNEAQWNLSHTKGGYFPPNFIIYEFHITTFCLFLFKKKNSALSLLLLHMSVCWHYICFMLLCNPVISFTWHPHGQHYMNICELHLEAFLHVKCLAVSLLQGEGPFAVTNQVSLLHLHPDTTKRRVQPQTANVGKSLCWKVGDFINSTQ